MKRFLVIAVSLATVSSCFASYDGYTSPNIELPGWLRIISFVTFAWGVLEIILFFKIWGMTNNIRKLTNHFCNQANDANPESSTKPLYKPTNLDDYTLGKYDPRLDEVKVGDKVRRESDGKILEVIGIEEKSLDCRGGILDGIHSYPKDVLSIV